mmetsp:Transcript_67824/g.196168  ORF Transcript_67824/g.196168 Transcript_67824/m.196168 type:complete len:409 (-) Transcript_67824:205-1431(-)
MQPKPQPVLHRALRQPPEAIGSPKQQRDEHVMEGAGLLREVGSKQICTSGVRCRGEVFGGRLPRNSCELQATGHEIADRLQRGAATFRKERRSGRPPGQLQEEVREACARRDIGGVPEVLGRAGKHGRLELQAAEGADQGPRIGHSAESRISGAVDRGLQLPCVLRLQVAEGPPDPGLCGWLQQVAHDAPTLEELGAEGGATLGAQTPDAVRQWLATRGLLHRGDDLGVLLGRWRRASRTVRALRPSEPFAGAPEPNARGHQAQSGGGAAGRLGTGARGPARRHGGEDLGLRPPPVLVETPSGVALEGRQSFAMRLFDDAEQQPLAAEAKEVGEAQSVGARRVLRRLWWRASCCRARAAADREVGDLPVQTLRARSLQQPRGAGAEGRRREEGPGAQGRRRTPGPTGL